LNDPVGGSAPTSESDGGFHGLLRRVVEVQPHEVRAMLTSFAYFFFVLSGYFVLRPIRDAVAAASGATQLPWLFAGTLAVTLVCNPLFSALVVKYPVRKFIAITYHFFIANLLVFFVLLRSVSPAEGSQVDIWVGRAFYIWTSVFNLFVVSVFWCFMADVFRSEQAKRLFGFIGVGGTLGSIVGSAATAALAPRIGAVNLLLVSAVLLELAVIAVLRFPARSSISPPGAQVPDADRTPIGGSVWAGFTRIVASPYLLGIALFIVIFTVGSTFLYFAQSELVGRFYPDRSSRTAVLAEVELAVQVLTVITQIFFTGRVIRWLGLAAALAFLPFVTLVGFGALAALPTFATLSAFIVLRRAGNFAINNPAMEVLFTVVSREDKYKAKNFIETFVYRGGDQVGAWAYAGLVAIGFGFSQIAIAAMPMAAAWLLLGLWLGRRQTAMAGGERLRPAAATGHEQPAAG
jgi:AAA family ATP:ADP antiporter